MSPRRRTPKDVIFLERKIKYAKRFQREFQKHIEQLEELLKLTKGSR